jgi:hypothetical protein
VRVLLRAGDQRVSATGTKTSGRAIVGSAARRAAAAIDWVAIAVVAGPLVVALGRVVFGPTYVPSGDTALIEMNVRDVGHLPLLGPYSRFGWNHPGPILYYVLAIPFRLSGSSSTGLLAGSLVLNIIAIAFAALIARRVGGRVAMIATLAVAVLIVHGLGSADLMSPWNPEITVLPTLVVLVTAWAVASGYLGALPALAISASFVVQTHVGYGPVVVALVLLALAFVVVDQVRTRDDRRRLVRYAGYAGLAVVVLWLPPIIEQFTHHPGNLGKLVLFSRRAGDRSLLDGMRIVASAYALGPPWLLHSGRASVFSGEVVASGWAFGLVTFAALAAAVVVCIAKRERIPRPLTRAIFLLAAVVPVEIATVAKIVGPAYSYLLQWLWVLAAATWVALAYLFAACWPRVRKSLPMIVILIAVGFAGANFVTVSGSSRPDSGPLPEVARTFIAPVLDATRNVSGTLRVQGIGIDSAAYAEGLQLQLVRHGHDALAPDEPLMEYKLRSARIDHGDQASTVLTVAGGANQALSAIFGVPFVPGRDDVERLRSQPGFREVATVTILATPTQLQQTRDAVARLQARGAITTATAHEILTNTAAGLATFAVFISNRTAELPTGMATQR